MGYKEIGRKIQRAREEAGLSQEELAARLGCSQSTLSNYELGKRRLYLAQLEAIGRALGKPIHYFLEDEGLPGPEISETEGAADLREVLGLAARLSPEERRQVLDFVRFLLWRKGESG
ncbi:MAG: helix-turn-helix transcriptional regulator [Firmicutes bacterium]|nr:helix-turn-helix transcriptional regulator [Bacillota bacterium]